jgi:hypothetical protein
VRNWQLRVRVLAFVGLVGVSTVTVGTFWGVVSGADRYMRHLHAFPNGVAAGDVAPTSAILWTRSDFLGPLLFEYADRDDVWYRTLPSRGFGRSCGIWRSCECAQQTAAGRQPVSRRASMSQERSRGKAVMSSGAGGMPRRPPQPPRR